MDRRWTVSTATVLVVGLVPGVAAAETATARTGSPGAPGIGDTYYPLDGNGGYQVEHYDLDVRYDPATDALSATAAIRAVATQDLSSFNLDFVGLDISELTVDGAAATFERDAGELTVTPAQWLPVDSEFTVTVTYEGVPETIETALGTIAGFIHTDDGALVVGQPDVAATWFPANDHPLDAATFDVALTVPEGLEALSNGELVSTETADGLSTWRWAAAEPMAPYLAVVAIGEFDVRAYEEAGLRYWDAFDPDLFTTPSNPEDPASPTLGEIAEASLARQPEVLDWLAGLGGPYPFVTAGGIVDDSTDLRFALETQTRPIYSPFFFTDQVFGDLVVVHELAHQWFGDDLRLGAWQDIWLNEGFATYAEWLWLEKEGLATAQQVFDDSYATVPADDPFWTVLPGDPGPDALFDGAVYNRGAMTLHALRQVIGDETFFAVVRAWAESQAGDTVSTDEFVALAEELSGRQLDDLFDAWLYTQEKPALG
ncbi:M1 family metallopeptidase [Geodermatophilus sp. YIM 151500]|uniref:M1 family metallopeptidase n=1 Tax=Geodermatophilus sp. YIM 151500 TaxID=2984531 RepID=UPI0021E4A436|nr:M1 family metallopeptidase [Geodermatophilus sp. YIM 151500]MCV2489409.1 M1 family metallopeptidase [Geodermatophilus sp. YIM 151500]